MEDQESLLQIKKELKMKSEQSLSVDTKENPYIGISLACKYHIYVGKDSKNNDGSQLFAKQNDFWFHARSVSGSHVVLRVENTKEVIPKNILQKTASLAAFYSKAKLLNRTVTYTLKNMLIKMPDTNRDK